MYESLSLKYVAINFMYEHHWLRKCLEKGLCGKDQFAKQMY